MNVALQAPHRLIVQTVPIDAPADLLARLPHPAALAWIRHGEGLIGWGQAARTTIPGGQGRFRRATAWLADLFGSADIDDPLRLPGTGPLAFGSFTFDPDADDSVLIVPRTILGHRGGHAWITTCAPVPAGHTVPPHTIPSAIPAGIPARLRWNDGALSAPAWERAVATAVRHIRRGDLDKVVLARDLYAEADEPIDSRVLLGRLARRYPECYTFAVDGLVGATPELLIRRAGDAIDSLVLAGTTPRGDDPAGDAAHGDLLRNSAKDLEEHRYAAAMVRAALTPLCAELHVPAEPELLALPNVIHLASPVHGRLDRDRSVLDVVAALHPTPAVGGTPTATAVDLIKHLEGMDRGRYAGPVGWIDARGDGEWGIALRCAQLDGPRARLYAGCGLVAGSEPAAELAEAQAKFRVMQDALEA